MTATLKSVLHLGIVGAGGFARHVTDLVSTTGAEVAPAVRLIAVTEPDSTTHAARLAELRQRGIDTLPTFDALLARTDLEAVWLPLPIALHRPFTERALAAGKAVLCEKPVAGTVQDVDALIAARDRARLPVAIGYQNTYLPSTKILRGRLQAGAIGQVRTATLHACWPRPESYYRRNDWAGKFQHRGVWILDSPANNALAHYIQLALLLLDAPPARVEAELYRVMAIENYDTISARVTLANNVPLLILLTHACRTTVNPRLTIHGTAGRLEWESTEGRIVAAAGTQTFPHEGLPGRHLVERFARLVKGVPDDTRLVATLENSRPQTVVVNAAAEASPIRDVPREFVERIEQNGEIHHAIRDIEKVFAECAAAGQMLHESGRLPFTQPDGRRDVTGYREFRGPA